jgi:hypothetical protein
MQASAGRAAPDAYEKEGGGAEDKAGSGPAPQLAPELLATSKTRSQKHALDQGRAAAQGRGKQEELQSSAPAQTRKGQQLGPEASTGVRAGTNAGRGVPAPSREERQLDRDVRAQNERGPVIETELKSGEAPGSNGPIKKDDGRGLKRFQAMPTQDHARVAEMLAREGIVTEHIAAAEDGPIPRGTQLANQRPLYSKNKSIRYGASPRMADAEAGARPLNLTIPEASEGA